MIRIDKDRALELLENVVAENPDRVYESPAGGWCSYIEVDSAGNTVAPGCGVGVALHKAGLSLAGLEQLDDLVGGIAGYEGEVSNLELTDEAIDVFNIFQAAQDDKINWQESLNLVKDRLKLVEDTVDNAAI